MAGTAAAEAEKRLRNLRKKLTQIDKLKTKGGPLSPEEEEKVSSEAKVLAEIRALEKGEEVPAAAPPAAAAATTAAAEDGPVTATEEAEGEKGASSSINNDGLGEQQQTSPRTELPPAEAEKRVRNLKKKLGQIQKLKERDGDLTKEEADKVASESAIVTETMELEIGLLDPDAKRTALTLQKKLQQIAKLRTKGGQLTNPEREKMSKDEEWKKELNDILAARVPHKAASTNGTSGVTD